MDTLVAASTRVPVLSLLLSDGLMAVTLRITFEPFGITTFPEASFTSLATVFGGVGAEGSGAGGSGAGCAVSTGGETGGAADGGGSLALDGVT